MPNENYPKDEKPVRSSDEVKDKSRVGSERTEQASPDEKPSAAGAPPITDEMREAGERYQRDHGDKR